MRSTLLTDRDPSRSSVRTDVQDQTLLASPLIVEVLATATVAARAAVLVERLSMIRSGS